MMVWIQVLMASIQTVTATLMWSMYLRYQGTPPIIVTVAVALSWVIAIRNAFKYENDDD